MLLTKQLLAFRPTKLDWIFATKTFLAGMLALYVAFALNLAYPIWAIGTVFVIANPYSGMTSSKSLYRVLGTFLGAAVSVIALPHLIHMPVLFTVFLAVWVGICLYLSLLDRTPRSYVSMLAGYTAVIICYNVVYFIDTASIFDMAVGRFLEITVGVLSSAVVTTTIFPMHIGPAVETRVSKTLDDTKTIFDKILSDPSQLDDYSQALGNIARDIADIHVMAVHLSYEKSTLKGMTRPLQEMLNQLSLLVSNLVAMSERMKQLDQLDPNYRAALDQAHAHIVEFLKDQHDIDEATLNQLPERFEQDFKHLQAQALPSQQVMLGSLKMDIRHFIQNIRAIRLLWQRVKQGDSTFPVTMMAMNSVSYPTLHRDAGVAIRGGISACIIILISTGFWIMSGWKAGFMMAEMAAISACILTAMDNPVPALKMFIRGNIYAAFFVFLYAYGIFPHITEFWQLFIVLAPFVMFCLMLFLHPPLIGISLPVLMGTIMGLNFQNRYSLDQILFFDASIGTVLGPIISVFIINLVRAMSPDITAQRILAQHYKAIRQALYLPYGLQFRIHLRSMLDRIGVLNTKMVQSAKLKQYIQLALVESSAVIDLTRIQELANKLEPESDVINGLEALQQDLDDYFRAKENNQKNVLANLLQQIVNKINHLNIAAADIKNVDVAQRIQYSLNNIQSSLCHVSSQVPEQDQRIEAIHG
ncbi:fusaric acid resistance protein [Acinetobacter sp. ANC 5054]|uniref:FUSC family protein n=1 Tax=Acinetobacter sp. ANC 5054 TaxID=1977877 RepID=UPI000A33B231|nr:FUSC family protein [Acinetobacter sp. ANC 5054]OTG81481.1 fusaric acid resistance protein [Acinetobacter sp. ANC 5054]